MLTAVVIVNEAIEKENATQFTEKLNNAGLTSVEESLCNSYLSQLISAKKDKTQVVNLRRCFLSIKALVCGTSVIIHFNSPTPGNWQQVCRKYRLFSLT